jgi:5-methylthioadenosine/S-adenosylhomocysteine deaminase
LTREQVDLLVKGGVVVTVDAHDTILEHADLAVRGNTIVAIGDSLPYVAGDAIDARGKVVLPGLVDVHMHETLLRGVCEDLPLMEWLQQICFPKDRSFQAHHSRAAALMSQLEMIKAGITTFVDIFRYPDECAEVAEQSGLRAVLSPQIIETPPGAGETLESACRFVEAWRDRVPRRIHAWFGPHAPYSCSPELYREVVDLAERYGVGIHTHLSETQDEVEQIRSRYGMSPVAYLDSLGALGPQTLAAHCVAISDQDIEILKRRDVAVAHNPTSNAKTASGICPASKLVEAGVRVGLATDSNLSNNRLDMFAEMKMAALLQKLARSDATALPSRQALRLATIDGARCLGLGHEIGSLEAGKKADIILVDFDQPHLWPLVLGEGGNVIAHLVYAACAADVDTTIVDGRVLMRNRQVCTLDERAAQETVSAAAADLLRRADEERRRSWKRS